MFNSLLMCNMLVTVAWRRMMLMMCSCSRSGGCALVALSAAEAVHPEGSSSFAPPPGQTPPDPVPACRGGLQPHPRRYHTPLTLLFRRVSSSRIARHKTPARGICCSYRVLYIFIDQYNIILYIFVSYSL